MGKFSFNGVVTSVIAAVALIYVTSCVNSKYELSEENLDLKVTVFQEGVSLPLGSTDKITLESLYAQLDDETKEMLKEMNGAYMFHMADSLEVSMDDISEALSAIRSIEAVPFDESFNFSLESVDLSGLEITGQEIGPKTVSVSNLLKDVPDLNAYLPKITEGEAISVDVPKPDKEKLKIDLSSLANELKPEPVTIFWLEGGSGLGITEDDLNTDPLLIPIADTEMDYGQLSNVLNTQLGRQLPNLKEELTFEDVEITIPIEFTLPKEIAAVKSIKLHPDAQFELKFKIENSLFTSGWVAPDLDIDLHNLLHIDRIESGMDDGAHVEDVDKGDHLERHVFDKFVMKPDADPDKNWASDHIYHVDSLAISPSDWEEENGAMVLRKNAIIKLGGELLHGEEEEGLKTTLRHLVTHTQEPMTIQMEIIFNHFEEIDDIKMELAPQVEAKTFEFPININPVTLPEVVKDVEYIEFNPANPLELDMSAVLSGACSDLDVVLKTLEVQFPEGMVIKDKDNYDGNSRKLLYEDVSLKEGLNDEVVIERINLPDLVNGALSYSDKIVVNAVAEAGGELSSKALLDDAGSLAVNVSVNYEPELSDYSVEIDDYPYSVSELVGTIEPIYETLDKEVGELLYEKPITVSLKQDSPGENKKIVVSLIYPQHDVINLYPDEGGLTVDFPDLLKFTQETVTKYGINESDNTMTFPADKKIPSEDMVFEIENIVVNVGKDDSDPDNVKYFVSDSISVDGGIRLAGTTLHMQDIQDIKDMNANVSFGVEIPDMAPAEFGLDSHDIIVDETLSVGKIETELPEMIESIEIEDLVLDNVYLDLEVDASSVKNLLGDVEVTLDLQVALPQMLQVACETEGITVDKDNVLKIYKGIDDTGKIAIDGVHVLGFDLSSVEIADGKLTVDVGDIPVKGYVHIKNVTINVEDLKDTDIVVSFNGGLSSRDADNNATANISIDRIEGYVGLEIDPVKTKVDLSSLSEVLNGDNLSATIDVHTYWLTLDVATNIDIPLKGTLEILPWYGGVEGEKFEKTIEMYPEKRVDGSYKFFISNMDPATGEGRYDIYSDYEYIGLDLISMLYKEEEGQKPVVADSLHISVVAGVDPDRPCILEPAKDYALDVDYAFSVPMELGEDFEFEYRDTIQGLPAIMGQILEYGSLGLGGNVTNSFPLNLDLQFRLLDSQGEVIPMGDGAGTLKIASCRASGEPVTTGIDVVLSAAKGADLTDLDAVELIFKADSRQAAGVPISPDSFLQVVLNARIPNGITVDLADLPTMAEEGEDDETNE